MEQQEQLGALVLGPQVVYESQVDHECAAHALNNLFAYTWTSANALNHTWQPPLHPELSTFKCDDLDESPSLGYTMSTVYVALRLRGIIVHEHCIGIGPNGAAKGGKVGVVPC